MGKLVQKWLLFFGSRYLRAGSCLAAISELFAVSAFLEPAEAPYATELERHNRYRRV
jgi:hypothetical protein